MAMSNITVNDGKATPVAHVFVGIADGDDARFVNDAAALTLKGQETLNVAIKRSTGATQASTARITMWDPVEVTDVSGVTRVDHGSSADLRWNFAPTSTEAERKDIVMMSVNAAIAQLATITKLIPIL